MATNIQQQIEELNMIKSQLREVINNLGNEAQISEETAFSEYVNFITCPEIVTPDNKYLVQITPTDGCEYIIDGERKYCGIFNKGKTISIEIIYDVNNYSFIGYYLNNQLVDEVNNIIDLCVEEDIVITPVLEKFNNITYELKLHIFMEEEGSDDLVEKNSITRTGYESDEIPDLSEILFEEGYTEENDYKSYRIEVPNLPSNFECTTMWEYNIILLKN